MTDTADHDPAPNREFDFNLETVLLLVLSAFMLLFGVLLFAIHTGALPYTPDSTLGLFLVIVALQVITLGKTPFGEVRRTWLVILTGIAAGLLGMAACFIPGVLTALVRILVGMILTAGGAALLARLLLHKKRAALWLRVPGILRHLTVACALVYIMAFLLGLVTLLPGLTTNPLTAVFLIIDGASLFYLAWCIQVAGKTYPQPIEQVPGEQARHPRAFLVRDAPLPLTTALLIFLGVLLAFLALLLVPVNLGILPFSPDGQLGLLLVIMAIQMLAMGETPVGQFRRSWVLVVIGLVFVAMGVFACIVPGRITDIIRLMLGLLNLAGGILLLAGRVIPILKDLRNPPAEPIPIPPQIRNLLIILTVLNCVSILFGISVLLPGFLPYVATVTILFCNGLLLFALAYIVSTLPSPGSAT